MLNDLICFGVFIICAQTYKTHTHTHEYYVCHDFVFFPLHGMHSHFSGFFFLECDLHVYLWCYRLISQNIFHLKWFLGGIVIIERTIA